MWFPSGEGRKWETWKTYCQLISNALRHPEDGGQGLLVQTIDIASQQQKFHTVGWNIYATLPEATSTVQEEANFGMAHSQNKDGVWKTCICLFLSFAQTDYSVLVYNSIGRRLANSP